MSKGFLKSIKDVVFGTAGAEQRAPPKPAAPPSPLVQAVMVRLSPTATKADRNKLLGVLRWLERSPSGVGDMRLIVDRQIELFFDLSPAGSGGYRRASNSITLSRMRTAAGTVATLVHEVTHAREHFAGRSSDAQTLARNAYAEGIVREESKTYFHEVVVCRELLHITRQAKREEWKQFLTEHTLQMWFQLVHGVLYQRRPSEAILEADAALSNAALEAHYRDVYPAFQAYVSAYHSYELLRWDMVHGLRPWLPAHELSEVLATSFERLPAKVRIPMRST
jgi:hypothetical protein